MPSLTERKFPVGGIVGVLTGPPRADDDFCGADAVEIRADLFDPPGEALYAVSRISRRLPVVFTVRRAEEGGRFARGEVERLVLYREALRRGAVLVDVELGSDAAATLAREHAPLVVSHHDFSGMSGPGEIGRITRSMEAYPARAIKLVPSARRLGDAARMVAWVEAARDDGPRRIGFAMGSKGLPSRILCLSRGAPFTYGALGEAVAPGQPTVRVLREVYRAGTIEPEAVLCGAIGDARAMDRVSWLSNRALARAAVPGVLIPLAIDSLEELEPCWVPLGLSGLCVEEPFQAAACRRADELEASRDGPTDGSARNGLLDRVDTITVERRPSARSGVWLRASAVAPVAAPDGDVLVARLVEQIRLFWSVGVEAGLLRADHDVWSSP